MHACIPRTKRNKKKNMYVHQNIYIERSDNKSMYAFKNLHNETHTHTCIHPLRINTTKRAHGGMSTKQKTTNSKPKTEKIVRCSSCTFYRYHGCHKYALCKNEGAPCTYRSFSITSATKPLRYSGTHKSTHERAVF